VFTPLLRLWSFAVVLSVAAADAASYSAETPAVVATRLESGTTVPVIDGLVTDEVWTHVEPYDTFTQQDPVEGASASERTEVRVLYDQSTIYIGVICFDREPDKIIVSQSRRDAQLTDVDSIVLVLDTFNDNQNAFVFGTNALGIEYDGQVSGEGLTGGGSNISPNLAGAQTNQQRGSISAFN